MADNITENSLFSFRCPGSYVETGGAPLWAPQYVTRQEFRKALPRPKTVTSPPDRNDLPISAAAPRRDLQSDPARVGLEIAEGFTAPSEWVADPQWPHIYISRVHTARIPGAIYLTEQVS